MSILNKIKELAGSAADAVIPGDQSGWHRAAPQPTQQQAARGQQAINRATGFPGPAARQTMGPVYEDGSVGAPQLQQLGQQLQQINSAYPTIRTINKATGFHNPVLEDWFRRDGVDY